MKLLYKASILFCLLLSVVFFAQNISLTISITGFSNNKGKAMIAIYNSKESFLETAYKTQVATISNQQSSYTISLPKGKYAVAIFHDENNNGKMDKNIVGIPTEKYGFSNNARGFMSAPSFSSAQFSLDKDKSISIKVH